MSVFLDQLYVFAGMTTLVGSEVAGVERAPLDASGKVGEFVDLPALPLVRAHSHQTPLYEGHFYSVGGSRTTSRRPRCSSARSSRPSAEELFEDRQHPLGRLQVRRVPERLDPQRGVGQRGGGGEGDGRGKTSS